MPNENRLGLTDEEVAHLQKSSEEKDLKLIRQYQMVVACPRDPGARGIFAGMLDDWRKERANDSRTLHQASSPN